MTLAEITVFANSTDLDKNRHTTYNKTLADYPRFAEMASVLRVADTGRLNLPVQVRKLVGLERGGLVSVWVEDGELHVRPVKDVMVALQTEAADLFANTDESVDLLLAERRIEEEGESRS